MRLPPNLKGVIFPSAIFIQTALLLALAGVMWNRPCGAVALGVIPAGAWSLAGMVAVAVMWVLGPRKLPWFRRSGGALLACWILFGFVAAEEPASVARGIFRPNAAIPNRPMGDLRVISLNCGGGLAEAAREVIRWQPDLVLLQEVPPGNSLEEVAHELWGEDGFVDREFDTAILGRGRWQAAAQSENNRRTVTRAGMIFTNGMPVSVASLHLMVPPIDLSLWKPSTWKSHEDSRRLQRNQLVAAVGDILCPTNGVATIIAGDFNAPQRDWLFKVMEPRLRDVFRSAGRGWGNTVDNDYAVLRIDQIWVSRHFKVHAAWAVKTEHSDHRMVIADVSLVPESK